MKNLHDRLSLCKCRVCRPFGEHFNKATSLGSARIKKFLLAGKKLCAYQNRKLRSRLGLQCQQWLALADWPYGVGNIVFHAKAVFRGILAPASLKPHNRHLGVRRELGVPGYPCPGLIEATQRVLRRLPALAVFRGILAPASLKQRGAGPHRGPGLRVPGYPCPGLIEAAHSARRRRRRRRVFRGILAPASLKGLRDRFLDEI